MVKILSKAGDSLADTYDVKGSIAGIDQLETHELPIVHEMGGTVFSERLSGDVRRSTTGAILQNVTWDLVLTDLPNIPFRMHACVVLVDTAGRINRAQLSIRDPENGREVPFFSWHTTNDIEQGIRIVENGGAAGNMTQMIGFQQLPILGIGSGQPQPVQEIAFRGLTSAFGAGDVTVIALIYNNFAQIGGISSRGLPVPSW